MNLRIGIILMGLLLCCGCNKPTSDPRIAQLEAEIKRLKSGDKSLEAAKKAIRELKKMNSVIELGVNYSDYRKILLETKPIFDEALSDTSEGKIKTLLSASMKAYVNAGNLWNVFAQRSVDMGATVYFSEAEKEQFRDYDLDWKRGEWGDGVDPKNALHKMWGSANRNVLAVEELVKQEATKP